MASWTSGPASVGRRAARPVGAGPAGGGHRPARAGAVRRSGGQRQDDDARGSHRLADRHGRRSRDGRGHHVQQASGGRAPASGSTRRSSRSAIAPGAVRVRTFHALGLEILRSAGRPVEPLVDRIAVLRDGRARTLAGPAPAPGRCVLAAQARPRGHGRRGRRGSGRRPDRPGVRGLRARGRAARRARLRRPRRADASRLLEADPALLARWRGRCAHLLVDEVQDVDRSQLRLALLLAAPAHRIFLVGDDDQSIYGWRLADVRRVLELAGSLPGLRRVDLVTNYRCPGPVVERAVRLVEHNRERFAKVVRGPAGATGRLILAPDGADEVDRVGRILDAWPDDDGTRAFLARTNRELLPALVVALERRIPFRADRVATPLERPADRRAPGRGRGHGPGSAAPPARPARARRRRDAPRTHRTSRRRVHPPPAGRRRSSRGPRRTATSTRSSAPSASAGALLADLRTDDAHADAWRRPTRRRASSSTTSPSSGWRPAASRAHARSPTPRTRTGRSRRSAASPTSPGPGRAGR